MFHSENYAELAVLVKVCALLSATLANNSTFACVQFVLIFAWVDYSPARYGNYVYPLWADALGWLMSFSVVIWIPVYAVFAVWKEYDGNLLQVSCVCR